MFHYNLIKCINNLPDLNHQTYHQFNYKNDSLYKVQMSKIKQLFLDYFWYLLKYFVKLYKDIFNNLFKN
jgi:hypothetical protein